ncbi:centrosome and spindle pole-associated protein 1 isoform X4 [Catharus ustulatus]|uniref:centrosome and spindle pole-associated protein 1 isoform X4 n=1 Tax=Catharus ustulatus TaxID=91951 RepID=UPI00140D76CF|nr:centrosome and spindle pole-associated protein 1 isoform X4 [Catharus ustulatus]
MLRWEVPTSRTRSKKKDAQEIPPEDEEELHYCAEMMADDLEKFIEDQKAKLAQDKAELENDLPYMEMRNKESEKISETSKMLISVAKENIPPNSQQNCPFGDYGLSLPLGEEYERKKHKLKEELRQDYRRYLSQKNHLTTGEVDPYTQGLSLPIDERRSAKERLRLERNKEYNQYLREKEEWNERLRKLGKKNRENEMHRNKAPIAVTRLQPELHTEVQPSNTGAEPPKKDAFTSTEGCEELLNKRWQEEDRYHRLDDEVELRSRLLSKRLDGDLDAVSRRPHGFASQSVIPNRKHHGFDEDGDFGRRYHRVDHDPETNAEVDPRFRCESTYARKTPRGFYAERPHLNGMVGDVPADYEEELKERAHVRPFSRTGDSRSQVRISSSANGQAKSAAERQYATGLVLGGQDRELLQRRKEKYRQELMEQIAEQQRNKRREKELELSVAVSGARDPEKKPNRLKQFGFTARAFEEKVPPERPRVAFQTPMPARSTSPVNEDSQSDKDFQRGIVSSLGEMAASRLAPLPPPPPPVLTENYKTPYDDAYYFYGARNPLDPALAYYSTGMMGMQPVPSLDPPLGQAPVEQPVSNIGQRNTGDRQRSIGVYSEEKTKPSKEATLSYQQELQQQIREREERRKQEREEKEKLEAEMRNYNPWGRGGGGAPLKDAEGNLITDLNIMHKRNEEAYHNPEARLYEDKRAIVDLSLASSRPENSEASTNKIAGIAFAQASPFARGNVFGEPPSPEQLKRQESYKNFLRLQIEEKRRREEAEREKLRMEEEKEEKRLAEQRMRIQKAYEEELEEKRRKDEERRLKNKEIIQLGEERRKEAEKQEKEKEEKQEQLRQYFEKEKVEDEKMMMSRQSSPVIPALQNKLGRKEERIPSAESHLSYYAQDSAQPRASSPPVPARRNQLRSLEERKNVINELSEMRKQLRSEERRLQEQLLNVASRDNVPITRRRREKNPRDIFEMARLRLQAPVRRPSLKEAQDPVNIQNIWDFNELKYKDSETRMGLRHMYPDPPKDDQTLEIQQQALLREQQRKLDRMRMRRETEAFDDHDDSALDSYPQTMGLFSNKSSEFQKNSLLESDSAFIGANGETFSALEEVNLLPQHPPSARERRRLRQRALESAVNEEVPRGQTPLLQPDSFSVHSNFSLDVDHVKGKNEERLHRLTELQQKSPSSGDDISLGDVEDLLKRAQSRASSIDTVATEPWLRPGTSATLRRLLEEQPSPAKLTPEPALPLGWQGLSTAHG